MFFIGESDPYSATSESMPGDDSVHYGDSIYGRIPPPIGSSKAPPMGGYLTRSQQQQQSQQAIPWAYRSSMSNDRAYYGAWDD